MARTTAVAVPQQQAVTPAATDEELEFIRAHKGQGVSTAADDNLVPLVYVLQTASKQAIRSNPAYVPGAEGGAFMLRGAAEPIVSGEQGFIFQPCYFYKDFAEWIPRERGSGLVGMHRALPEGATKIVDDRNPNKVKWRTEQGNDLVERRNHLGFIVFGPEHVMPYAIPFTSTGHSVSRNWMTVMQSRTINGIVPPSYCYLYKFTTVQRSNAQGTWFVPKVEAVTDHPALTPSHMVNAALRERGKEFFESCLRGDKSAEAMEDDHAAADDGVM